MFRILGRLLWLLSFTAAFTPDSLADTQTQPNQEFLVKAAFMYNFAKFVTWPEETFVSPDQAINLCVIGENPFANTLDSLSGKTVHGRPLTTTHIDNPKDIEGCHILFISRSEASHLDTIFSYSRYKHVLTIGDIDEFIEVGGMIGFITVNDKIRFRINYAAAREAELEISSRLLNLAVQVDRGTQ